MVEECNHCLPEFHKDFLPFSTCFIEDDLL